MARANYWAAGESESLIDGDHFVRKATSDAACGNVGADRETNVTASHAECNAKMSPLRFKELELNRVRRKLAGAVSLPNRTASSHEAAAST